MTDTPADGPAGHADDDLVAFSAEPTNQLTDLVGDPVDADLRALLGGNQWMVVPELVSAFRAAHPDVTGVFYETLPPGILVGQLRAGGLRLGSLVLRFQPDVIAASPDALGELNEAGLVGEPVEYASNELALLVPAVNPAQVHGLSDLGRPDVRVAMPDPRTEGVGRLIVDALRSVGGEELVRAVMVDKRAAGTTRLTRIHHRESPEWLARGEVDAAPLWATESRYHRNAGAGVADVPIEAGHNQRGRYAIALVDGAPHHATAERFVAFLTGPPGQEIYSRWGFAPPR